MRKLLKPKDILLLGLAHVLDLAEEIRDPGGVMSFSYKNMYGWIPRRYRRNNFHQLVSRSLRTNIIEKVEKNGAIYLRITSEGKNEIKRDFPMLSLQNKQWDGRWRIVMFDIEEINKNVRNRLREKLKELGFGMLQKSVFISPYDIIKDFLEFAEHAGIKKYLYLLETNNLTVGEVDEFADRVWKLNELNQNYREIVDEVNEIKNKYVIIVNDRTEKSHTQNVNNRNIGKLKKDAAMLRNRWFSLVAGDPFLPKSILPKPWWGFEAEKAVKTLKI